MRIEIFNDLFLVAAGRFYYTNPLNCNVYLIRGRDSLYLIDAGAGLDGSVVESVKLLGFSPEEIELIVLTHHHWDHSRGARDIKELTGCKVAIHELGVTNLESGNLFEGVNPYPRLLREKVTLKPDIGLRDGDILSLGDYEVRVIHTPGHTSDSICLLTERDGKKILFTGDTVMSWGELGVMSVETNLKMYKQSLEKLAKLRVDIMLPGHGIFIMSNAYDHIEHALEKLSSVWKDFTPFSNPIRDKIVNQLLY